jgi:uncharacterized protein YkwD
LCTGVAAPAAAAQACADANVTPTASNLARIRSATLCLINEERRRYGRPALRQDGHLAAAARYHTTDMVRRHYFAHTSPRGDTVVRRIRKSGYGIPTQRITVGENLAWGPSSRNTPAEIMSAWMRSPEHRSNILYPRFRQIGIAITLAVPLGGNQHSGATFTTEFAVGGR